MKDWNKVSEEELIKELERRAIDNKDNAILVREGKRSSDTVIYIGFLPYLPCMMRTGVAEARMMFGMKAEIASYLLNEESEVMNSAILRLEEGYVIGYQTLDLNLKHPKTGTPLKDAIKGKNIDWTNPTGVVFANEIVEQVRKDKTYKLFGVAGHLKDLRGALSIPDNDLDAKCGLQYDLLEIKRKACLTPMPPSMRGFLLMGRDDFVDWLREILGGADLLGVLPTLYERFGK
jgi:hypothetical protein